MKIPPRKTLTDKWLVSAPHDYFGLVIRILLNALLIIILVVLFVATYKAARDSFTAFNEPLEKILENLLLDVVLIVAVIEMATVVRGYLKDGHVHIRYIIDTVLVIMANEFVVVWFHKPTFGVIASLCAAVLALAGVRVLITRFSPED